MSLGSDNFLQQYSANGILLTAPVASAYSNGGVVPVSNDTSTQQGTGIQNPANDPTQPETIEGGVYNGIFIVGGGQMQSGNYVSGSAGWIINSDGSVEFNNGTFRGTVQANAINIPDAVSANSFHVDSMGNTWWGATTFAAAPASVSNSGAATFTNITLSGVPITTQGTFGGDGSDGALSITSGTTTIDLGNAAVVTKNYTSISITGTGALAFSNPNTNGTIVNLKSQGAVTLTSSATRLIDLRGIGATHKTNGLSIIDTGTHYGTDGTAGGAGGSFGTGGAGGATLTNLTFYTTYFGYIVRRDLILACGSGGADGGSGFKASGGTFAGGAGGGGGGVLIIECLGALNFTGTIDISGSVGSVGTTATSQGAGGAGGGGGAAGMAVILYKTLTSASGTITAAGGAGGNGGGGITSGTTGSGGGGGGGAGAITGTGATGGDGNVNDGNGHDGNAGATAGVGGGGGGGGGTSTASTTNGGNGGTGGASSSQHYLIVKNTVFA